MTTVAQRWVLIASVLAASMVFIDSTALTVAMAALQKDLNATGADLFWINNAYALPLAALLLLGGALGDRLGRKRMYMAGIIVFAVASWLCGCAPTTPSLIAARAAQGVGGALMIPGSLAIIADTFPPSQRGRAIGTWSAGTVIGSAIGPVLGGVLAQLGLWRGVFFINVPLAAAALAVLALKLPADRTTTAGHLHFGNALLATIGLAGLNFGLIEAPARGFGSPVIVATLGIGVVALIGFAALQHLFESRQLVVAGSVTLLFYGVLNALQFFLPLNLIQAQSYRAAAAGLTQLPLLVLLVALSRWAGGLVDRHGPRWPVTVGTALGAVGFVMLALPGVTVGPRDFWTSFFPGLAVLGVAMGLTVAPLSTTVMSAVTGEQAGLASGINSTLSRLSAVLAIAILGPVIVISFGRSLEVRARELPAPVRIALIAEAGKLGEAKVPAGLDAATTESASRIIRWAFVDAFRLVAWVGAAGSGLGALAAATLLRRRVQP